MSIAKYFVSTNWEVFVSELGYEFGFCSTKVQEYMKKGSDNHKAWNFLEILYIAISLELVTEFVREFIAKKHIPDIDSSWEWCENIENPNYLYIQHMCFSYLHALMLLRSGARKCNPVLVHAAKLKLYPLFFARNHPIYQNIIFKDELDNILMPSELKTLKIGMCQSQELGIQATIKGGCSFRKGD